MARYRVWFHSGMGGGTPVRRMRSDSRMVTVALPTETHSAKEALIIANIVRKQLDVDTSPNRSVRIERIE